MYVLLENTVVIIILLRYPHLILILLLSLYKDFDFVIKCKETRYNVSNSYFV